MWLSLYRGVSKRIAHPINFEAGYLARKFDLVGSSEEPKLALQIEKRHCCARYSIRVAAIASVLGSVFLLYNETMLCFANHGSVIAALDREARNRLWVIFTSAVVIMSAIVFSSFLTIFKLRFSDYLQLVPKLTDPVTFCSFTSLFSKVIAVTCFNFMVMAGEVRLRTDQIEKGTSGGEFQFQTSFIKFYSSMIETPFLGDQYNYLLPGAVLVFSILFLLLSVFRYESKGVAMLRRYNHGRDAVRAQDSGNADASILDSTRDVLRDEISQGTG